MKTPVRYPGPPELLALAVVREETPAGPVTAIVRRFARPDECRLCPRAACTHGTAFCVVRVAGYVPDVECPRHPAKG